MRYWLFAEPAGVSSEPVWMIYSDAAILAEYWEEWSEKVEAYNIKHDFDLELDPESCICDWVAIHWAVPATPENLLHTISAPKP